MVANLSSTPTGGFVGLKIVSTYYFQEYTRTNLMGGLRVAQ
jgi:hypothetical protein